MKVATHGPLFRYERPQKGRYRQFHQFDVEAFGYVCDVSRRRQVYQVAERVKFRAGPVDVLINNAGVVTGIVSLAGASFLATVTGAGQSGRRQQRAQGRLAPQDRCQRQYVTSPTRKMEGSGRAGKRAGDARLVA